MVGGMGGLTSGFSDLADGEDRAQLMNPQAIMNNLNDAKMIGPSSKMKEIGGGPSKLAITGMSTNSNQQMGSDAALLLFNTPHRFGNGPS